MIAISLKLDSSDLFCLPIFTFKNLHTLYLVNMRLTYDLCLVAMTGQKVLADTHYFYAGYFSQAEISGIEFDDEANTLTLVDNFTVTSGTSRWIAADVRIRTTDFDPYTN